MKKLKYLIIILLFLGIKNVYAYSFDNTIKVYDYAQVLTEKEENKLKEEVKNYIEKYNSDMVLVTVKYYEQQNLKSYMQEFYIKNNFGINNSGIIMVIDFKNNKENIDILNFNSTLYSEDEINSMLLMAKEKEKYYDKFLNFISYSDKYAKEDTVFIKEETINKDIQIFRIILISFIISTIITLIILFNNKKINNIDINYYIEKDSLVINKKEDTFLTTHTKQVNKGQKN